MYARVEYVIPFLFSPWVLSGQTPAFEVASVRPAAPAEHFRTSIDSTPGRFTCRYVTLENLLMVAFHTYPDRILAAPAWFRSDRFNIDATIPPGVPRDRLDLMVQTLLAERFN